jgi:hypothetical protein
MIINNITETYLVHGTRNRVQHVSYSSYKICEQNLFLGLDRVLFHSVDSTRGSLGSINKNQMSKIQC